MKPFNEHGTKEVKNMSVGQYALHGDVIIERVESLPENFNDLKKEPNHALAYGEVTGHVHKLIGEPGIDFDVRVDEQKKERHLRVIRPTALKHQEHSPIILPPGEYRIGIQREYDPFTKLIRQVVD
jgi:hypothetical protein